VNDIGVFKRGEVWWIGFRHEGQRVRRYRGRTKKEAQESLDAVLTGIRRTAATRLVSRGADPATVMAILRHSSFKMVMRYVHPSEKAKREAVELLSKENSVPGHNDDQKVVTFAETPTQEAKCAFG